MQHPLTVDFWYDVLTVRCCICFTPDIMGPVQFHFIPYSIPYLSIEYCPKRLGDHPGARCSFILVSSGFNISTLMNPFFAQSFSYCGVMNTNIAEAREPCRSLDVLLGSYVTSWISCHQCPWRNFGRPATPGNIYLCSSCSLFGDNGSHSGVPDLQEWLCYPLQTEIFHQLFFLISSGVFFDRGISNL